MVPDFIASISQSSPYSSDVPCTLDGTRSLYSDTKTTTSSGRIPKSCSLDAGDTTLSSYSLIPSARPSEAAAVLGSGHSLLSDIWSAVKLKRYGG
uniref:Uncharacterized protein n=1 Tax=Ascaris lumbricoides TaxID=6252 RepID=A0A0M3I350_ASCLU